jgi:hypothetical protein
VYLLRKEPAKKPMQLVHSQFIPVYLLTVHAVRVILLKRIFKKWDVETDWIDLAQVGAGGGRQALVISGDELSDAVKCGEFLD